MLFRSPDNNQSPKGTSVAARLRQKATADEPTPLRRSACVRTPSAYIRRLTAGEGTQTQWSRDGSIPKGMNAFPEEAELVEEVMDDYREEYELAAATSEIEGLEPRMLKEALSLPERGEWQKAMQEELDALHAAHTWDLEEPPIGANVVGSKWVFKIKRDSAGNIVRRKARLVAQGFTQVEGIDYYETYAPTAKLASLRTILAIAARLDMDIEQVDVKSAYLNGEMEEGEVVYMAPPPGYKTEGMGGRVLRLRKTIYGLKQSGRRWYKKFTWIMVDQLGYSRCDVDQAVYFRKLPDPSIVAVNVNDCLSVGRSNGSIRYFKTGLARFVDITDLGPIHWLLGIQIKRDRERKTIGLTQSTYINSLLIKFGFEHATPLTSPMDPNVKLDHTQSPQTAHEIAQMRLVPYREALGSLMYAALATRPDITFAVTLLSRFSNKPGIAHWRAVERVFRYLKKTQDYWLTYGGSEANVNNLVGFLDADGSMQEDRRAISGNAFLIDGGAVSWYSKKQEIVSLSTTESEYVAATHAAKEALWLRELIAQVFDTIVEPTTLFVDNQSAIALTKDHQYHARTKHIDIRYHFIRWIVEKGSIRIIYCPTGDMVADALTKPLPSFKIKHFATELGLRSD